MGGPGSGRRKASAVANAVAAVAQIQVPSGNLTPVADYELTDYDKSLIKQLQSAVPKSFIGTHNPLWNDAEELETMASVGFGSGILSTEDRQRLLAFAGGTPSINVTINDRFSKRHTVADMNIPRTPIAIIQLSMRYAVDSPFVAKAAKLKTNFTVKNFSHKTKSVSAKDFYDDYSWKLSLRSNLNKIVFGLYTVGLAPVYWGAEDGGEVKGIQVLDPRSVHIEEIMGKRKMWIRIDQAMIAAVKDPEGKESPGNRALYQSMPAYWIKQIKALVDRGQVNGLIDLPDDCYAVVENRYMAYNRVQGTLDGVPLQGAFDALQRYRLLAAGDFAVAWNVKNMLTLISEGDPKADPKDYKPADQLRLGKLQQQFANPDYALTIYCDPTTLVRYVVPPLEVFDPKKYTQVEKEIKEVLNLPSFMWANEGNGTYGAAQAEVQVLRQEVDSLRILLEEQFFRPFYTRLRAGARRPGFSANNIVIPQFDQDSLRDDAIWLSANAELYSKGALSLESLLESYGYNFEYEMAQKAAEHKKYGNTASGAEELNNSVARPLYEPSQGNLAPDRDKGGNSSGPGGTPSGRPRSPRNSGA